MEDVYAYYNLCTACGTCRADCTIFKVKRLDSLSPRSRTIIGGLLAQDRIEISPRVIEAYFSCTLCDMCHNTCPSGVDVPTVVKIIRRYIIEKELAPKSVNLLVETVKQSKNIFNMDNDDRLNWADEVEDIIKDKINKNAEIAFYIGCQESFKGSLFMMPESMVKILDKAGIDFTILGGNEWCCGNPAFLVGDRTDPIIEMVKHNVEAMESLGIKKVIMTCPGCYRAWTVAYPQILKVKKLPFEIVHSTEFIADLIKEGKIKIKKNFNKKVGYQDPCELGRISGIFDAPREIINAIPEIEFIELNENKMKATCCGGGGLCKATYDPLATEIASNKIDEFKNAGVEVIITSCPACFDNFATAIKDKENIELKDIHELVADSIE